MINVLLVEDHELYRMGLSMLLEKAEGINLVAEASDGIDGVKKARNFYRFLGLKNGRFSEVYNKMNRFLPIFNRFLYRFLFLLDEKTGILVVYFCGYDKILLNCGDSN